MMKLNRYSLVLLSGFVCALLFLLCVRATDEHQGESETISKVVELEVFIHHEDTANIVKIKEFGDLLRLMRSNREPENNDGPDHFFRKDGWRKPFIFERRREDNAIFIVFSSNHHHHNYNQPLSLTIKVTDDNKLATAKSWKSD
jgi:hypothetical protein